MKNYKKSEFKKSIGITKEDYIFIEKVRGKKSRAGMLKTIIKKYKENETDHIREKSISKKIEGIGI